MSTPPLPAPGTVVELTAAAEPLGGVRVVRADGDALTLALPETPDPAGLGAAVALRWPAGARGRYLLAAAVTAVDGHRVEVRAAGTPTVEQLRAYVRAGGGEAVLARRPGRPDVPGWVRDLSERGTRAGFADLDAAPGDALRLRVQLDDDLVELAATVLKHRRLDLGPMRDEIVAVFAEDERQARTIRRYVLRRQALARRHAADD